jgi:methanogenic corrinoid protein MtbC1
MPISEAGLLAIAQTARAPKADTAAVDGAIRILIAGLEELGIRRDCLVLAGGGPLDALSAAVAGADVYCPDASVAMEISQVVLRR